MTNCLCTGFLYQLYLAINSNNRWRGHLSQGVISLQSWHKHYFCVSTNDNHGQNGLTMQRSSIPLFHKDPIYANVGSKFAIVETKPANNELSFMANSRSCLLVFGTNLTYRIYQSDLPYLAMCLCLHQSSYRHQKQ